jgi:hypothetical protein
MRVGKPQKMTEYRAYIVGSDGRFLRAVQLVCPDDETAKEYAKGLVDGHDVELWQGDRKIDSFKQAHE